MQCIVCTTCTIVCLQTYVSSFSLLPLYYLVVSEIPHQSAVDVGVVGDATQDLGTLEGSVWV